MPRVSRELSALDVKRLEHPGRGHNVTFGVGGVTGLLLQITPSGGRTWLLRVQVGDRRREIGLGGYPDVTLAKARDRARAAKDDIRGGIDPVERRKAAKASLSQRKGFTFAMAVERYLATKLDGLSNAKHRAQWGSTLSTYAMPELGPMPVQAIQVQDILRALEPIWLYKTETATRVRGRIEAVLSWATVAGHRTGDNPARWGGNLKELLPPASKVAKKDNHPALALDDAPAWFAALRHREGFGARALEFAALTAARSGEVRGSTWAEIDLAKALWVIPAQRMKMRSEHRIPLTPEAVELLQSLPRMMGSDLVFPAARGGALSDMTLSAVMKRMHEAEIEAQRPGFLDRVSKRPAVPHGLRSTFRDWVAEQTTFRGEMAEVALAHRINNAVEASYRRGDMIEKRRRMMADWAGFLCAAKVAGKVVRIG